MNDIWLGGINVNISKIAIATIPHLPTTQMPTFPPGIVNGLFTLGWVYRSLIAAAYIRMYIIM